MKQTVMQRNESGVNYCHKNSTFCFSFSSFLFLSMLGCNCCFFDPFEEEEDAFDEDADMIFIFCFIQRIAAISVIDAIDAIDAFLCILFYISYLSLLDIICFFINILETNNRSSCLYSIH